MSDRNDDDLVQKLKEAFDSIGSNIPLGKYPEEAVKVGTFARAQRLDRLGIVTDAFYGDIDKDNNKIIIYTILLFPKLDRITRQPNHDEQYYLTNEYEYEVTAYLMIKPVDVRKLTKILSGGLL